MKQGTCVYITRALTGLMNKQLHELCSELLACKKTSRQQKWCCLRAVGQPCLRSILQNVNNPKYLKFASLTFRLCWKLSGFNSKPCHDDWISNVRLEFGLPLPCSVCPYSHVHSECTHNVICNKGRRILMTFFFRMRKSLYSVCGYRLNNVIMPFLCDT
jgi:hypothetical protein